jgi:hypothetical protein
VVEIPTGIFFLEPERQEGSKAKRWLVFSQSVTREDNRMEFKVVTVIVEVKYVKTLGEEVGTSNR